MSAHGSSDFLTPLRPERDVILGRASEWELCKAAEWASLGSPGIEDVDGAVRCCDERVVISDIAPVTTVGRRGSK